MRYSNVYYNQYSNVYYNHYILIICIMSTLLGLVRLVDYQWQYWNYSKNRIVLNRICFCFTKNISLLTYKHYYYLENYLILIDFNYN